MFTRGPAFDLSFSSLWRLYCSCFAVLLPLTLPLVKRGPRHPARSLMESSPSPSPTTARAQQPTNSSRRSSTRKRPRPRQPRVVITENDGSWQQNIAARNRRIRGPCLATGGLSF